METKLRILTREGTLGLRFLPRLSTQQYEAVLRVAALWDTRADLREAAKQLAIEWQSELEIEEE